LRFEILRLVNIKIMIFWVMMLYSSMLHSQVNTYRREGEPSTIKVRRFVIILFKRDNFTFVIYFLVMKTLERNSFLIILY